MRSTCDSLQSWIVDIRRRWREFIKFMRILIRNLVCCRRSKMSFLAFRRRNFWSLSWTLWTKCRHSCRKLLRLTTPLTRKSIPILIVFIFKNSSPFFRRSHWTPRRSWTVKRKCWLKSKISTDCWWIRGRILRIGWSSKQKRILSTSQKLSVFLRRKGDYVHIS